MDFLAGHPQLNDTVTKECIRHNMSHVRHLEGLRPAWSSLA